MLVCAEIAYRWLLFAPFMFFVHSFSLFRSLFLSPSLARALDLCRFDALPLYISKLNNINCDDITINRNN